MNYLKFIGWLLFVLGIIIVISTLFTSYNIISGKTEAPKIFKEQEEKKIALEKEEIKNFEEQMQKMLMEEMKNIIPSEAINKLMNLFSWSIFAFIFIFGGGKISTIGIKLLKN